MDEPTAFWSDHDLHYNGSHYSRCGIYYTYLFKHSTGKIVYRLEMNHNLSVSGNISLLIKDFKNT